MSKNAAVVVAWAVGLLLLACFEVLIWGEPIGRHFTLAGHLASQMGVIVCFGVPVVGGALDTLDLWEPRELRAAARRRRVAEQEAAEACAVAARERALGLGPGEGQDV